MPDIYVMGGGISTAILVGLVLIAGVYAFWRGTWGSKRDEK